MHFSSIVFIFVFLPIALLGYYLFYFSKELKNLWLVLISLVFYGWGDPIFLLFPIGITGITYLAGILMDSMKFAKKGILWGIVILNILLLARFKFVDNVNEMLNLITSHGQVQIPILLWPIGMAFMVLRSISYVADIYKGEMKADRNVLHLLLYMMFFPFVSAGPFIKYTNFAMQLAERKMNSRKFSIGCTRFTIGLGKKVILADNLGYVSELIFNWSRLGVGNISVPILTAWLGIVAFSLQIFLDLSGYCDMAIGLGLLFGFEFPENFDYPYLAANVSEFWEKWHITLVQWFREYVFLPLGGEEKENKDLVIRNLAITCFLLAFWHGERSTFIFLAMWHFLFLFLEKFIDQDWKSEYKWCLHIGTLLEVIIGWVMFRADDIYQAYVYLQNMFGINRTGLGDVKTWFLLKEYGLFLAVGILFCFPISKKANTYLVEKHDRFLVKVLSVLYPIGLFAVLLISLSYILVTENTGFVYF